MGKTAPNWDIWRHMPALNPLQAVALSFGIDPAKIAPWDRKGEKWVITHNNSSISAPGFADRLLLYRACCKESLSTVQLAEWAQSVGWNIPLELAALAPLPPSPPRPSLSDKEIEAALIDHVALPFTTKDLREEIERLGAQFVMDGDVPTIHLPDGTVQGELVPLDYLASALNTLWYRNKNISELGNMLLAPLSSGSGAQGSTSYSYLCVSPSSTRADDPSPSQVSADKEAQLNFEKPGSILSSPQQYPWVGPVREMAVAHYRKAVERGWGSDQKSIAVCIEKECAEEGITTVEGKKLSAPYIIRFGLKNWDEIVEAAQAQEN